MCYTFHMNIIDGKALAQTIKNQIAIKAKEYHQKHGKQPGLAVVLVGADPASEVYVRNKVKACEQIGIKSFVHKFEETATEKDVVKLVKNLNKDKEVNGILVQLPLPCGLDEEKILSVIDPKKDVDGFHVDNAGALFLGKPCLTACTPSGIIELVKSTGVNMEGKHAVVIGRSNIVGKPVAMLLLAQGCTVTICHSKTKDLPALTKQADILVVAIGRKHFVTGEMIKPGAIVIDVGINRQEGKIYGDVDFEQAKDIAGHITPVPGGVGPMTIAMLLSNTLSACLKS